MKSLPVLLTLSLLLTQAHAVEPAEVCIVATHCVSHGVPLARLSKEFGAESVFIYRDDLYQHACFKAGNVYVLSTYSKQGRKSVQPELLDVSLTPQPDCRQPASARRNLQLQTTPVSLGAPESDVVAKLGPANDVWQGPNEAYGLTRSDRGLVYSGKRSEDFVMVVLRDGHVVRVLGSVMP